MSCFNTLVHTKYGLGVYAQFHCHKKMAQSILAPLSLFLVVGIVVGMIGHVFVVGIMVGMFKSND